MLRRYKNYWNRHTFVLMRRFIAIFFLLLSLARHSEIAQLLKLPVLYAHFIQHKQENRSIDFLQFVKLHYADPSTSTHRDKAHDQLPFRGSEVIQSGFMCNVPLLPVDLSVPPQQSVPTGKTYITLDSSPAAAGHDRCIFQPPRI